MVPVLPAMSRVPKRRWPPVPPGIITWLSTRLTPSATARGNACLQSRPGPGISLWDLSRTDVTASGLQYFPRAANVAYAFDSINGVTYPTPSVIDATWSSGSPVWPLYIPSLAAIFAIAHSPVRCDNCRKYVLVENRAASTMVRSPLCVEFFGWYVGSRVVPVQVRNFVFRRSICSGELIR